MRSYNAMPHFISNRFKGHHEDDFEDELGDLGDLGIKVGPAEAS